MYVYVVDTGVNADHQQFAGRILPGYDGVNDGKGTNDCYGHGTHVAGIAAGSTVGIAPEAYIVPVRIFNCSGTATGTGFYNGLQFVLDDWAAKGYPPAVVNMSFSGPADATLDNALSIMHGYGLFIAAAAGNDGIDACTKSPARSVDVVAVGATDSTDAKPSWSNYGSCVDVFAPGQQITSAYITNNYGLAFMSGTSMAAPHVAGAAARYLSVFTTANPAEVTDAVLSSSSSNVLSNVGAGSPNKLLYVNPNGFAKKPGTPGAVQAVQGSRGTIANVSWIPPIDDGGAAIETYKIEASPSAGITGGATRYVNSGTSYAFTGLTPGVAYGFTVSAANYMGYGNPTGSPAITLTASTPDAPRNIAASAGAVLGDVNLSWIAPVNDGNLDITSYSVSYVPSDASAAATTVDAGPVLNKVLTGLTVDKQYSITVKAVNSLGSSVSSTPALFTVLDKIPTALSTLVSVQKTNTVTTASLSWGPANSNGGTSINEYVVTVTPSTGVTGALTRSAGLATSYDFTGLSPNIQYSFTVQARNAKGLSLPSNTSTATLIGTIPAAPTNLRSAVTGFGQVNLAWYAPTNTGGVALTGYILSVTPTAGGTSRMINIPSTATYYPVTGLTPGVAYTFKLAAINQYGVGNAAPTVQGIPYGQASTVRSVSIGYPATLKTKVAWTAPLNLGGAPLARYEIRWTSNSANTVWVPWVSTGTASTYTISGIPKGSLRYVEIRAVTAAGNGLAVRYAFRPTV